LAVVETAVQDAVLVLHQLRVRSQHVALLIESASPEDDEGREALAAVLGGLVVMIQSIEDTLHVAGQEVSEMLSRMVAKARDSINRIDRVLA
jgi:hypothetical protein